MLKSEEENMWDLGGERAFVLYFFASAQKR
jgi:hypothetical protein